MSSPDEHPKAVRLRSGHARSAAARYLFALTASLIGVLVTTVALELQVSDQPIYAPLIAVVAFTAWYGGVGPSVVAIAACWIASLWLLVEPRGELSLTDTEDMTRWWINLAVAGVVAGIGGILRNREQGSAVEATSAREAFREVEALQQLSAALASAATSSDVARAVSAHAPAILPADGVALAMIEGEFLTIVDPSGVAAELTSSDRTLELADRTLLTQAVRDGTVAVARDRDELREAYADSADLLPERVEAAIAVPVQAGGRIIGSIGFLFASQRALDDELQGLAGIVADLAGQALERARLYEVEQESRRALERILLVAPRFLAEDTEDAPSVICREARTTFGADYAVLWRIDGDELELLAIAPRSELAGTRLELRDFPRLREAIVGLSTSFVPDVLESSYGAGLEFVRRLGIRSSLRTPVVIAGRSELILSISWRVVVSPPDPATAAVARRFADQAGLALEQLERRRAQEDVAARADATRRLHDVTVALSRAATSIDVSNTCLEHALASVGAEAGFVILTGPEGSRAVELVTSTGYSDEELAGWRALDLDADVPFARAIASGEAVWALTAEDMSAFTGLTEVRSSGWVAVPLLTRTGVHGALHLSLRGQRALSDGDRQWLLAMVSQCGQALERSGLYERERQSRVRAERLQAITALLSNALTSADVADVVADAVVSAVEPRAIAVVSIRGGEVSGVLATRGERAETLTSVLEAGPDARSPGGRALRTSSSLLVEAADLPRLFPDLADELIGAGFATLFLVPLVAARQSNALLVAAWSETRELAEEDRAIVEALAGQAALAVDRARQFESEQAIAETLQRSVLPVSLPRVDGVQMAARYLPGSAQLDVGGDWFDALQLPDGKLGLVVGDVVGKGVQAAASMAQLRNALRAFSVERLKPPSALVRLNRLANDVLDTGFATLVYLLVDPESGVVKLASAGHPPPVVGYPDGRVLLLEGARGLPLGTGMEAKYRQETVELPAGSVIVLYTDGLVERRGHSIDRGLAELEAAVRSAPTDPDRLLEHLLEAVIGSGQRGDDIAVLAARLLPVAPKPLDLRVRAHVHSMELVRDAMRTWLDGAGLDRAESENVVLATWEACANAIEHAVDPSEDLVHVSARYEYARVRVTIVDSGRWAPPSDREGRGLGLRLIEALSTSVDVSTSAAGTMVTIEKALASEPTTAPSG